MAIIPVVLAQSLATASLSAITAALGPDTGVKAYNGPPPAGPDSSETNTLLTSGVVSTWSTPTYSASSSGMSSSGTFTSSGYAVIASGIATHAMISTSGSTQEQMVAVGSNWIPSQQTALDQLCYSSGNTYQCTTSGTSSTTAPSGTGVFVDGTAQWTYQGAGQLFPVSLGNALLTLGVTVQMSVQQICPSQSV